LCSWVYPSSLRPPLPLCLTSCRRCSAVIRKGFAHWVRAALYGLQVLILVLGLRRGEGLGLVDDDDDTINEEAEESDWNDSLGAAAATRSRTSVR
jgi:hypothetical protein